MKNKEALERRITAAEDELSRMRELLKQENTWKAENIVAGLIINPIENRWPREVILPAEHKKFCLGGAFGNPLILFNGHSKTAEELAHDLNKNNRTSGGYITIEF